MSKTDIQELWDDLSQWSQATFGDDSTRGPLGPLKHLEKKAREAQEAVNCLDELDKEIADCLILVMDSARRAGLSCGDLIAVAKLKMIANKTRKWPKPVADEPCEHFREVEAGT